DRSPNRIRCNVVPVVLLIDQWVCERMVWSPGSYSIRRSNCHSIRRRHSFPRPVELVFHRLVSGICRAHAHVMARLTPKTYWDSVHVHEQQQLSDDIPATESRHVPTGKKLT